MQLKRINPFRNIMIKQIIITAILLSVLSGCTGFYIKKAGNLEDNGRLEEAVEVWDKVLKRNPEHITALINRAVDKSLLGDYSGAIDDYTGVIAIDSTMVLAWFNRGKNKKRLDNIGGALEDFNKAFDLKAPGSGKYAVLLEKFDSDVNFNEICFERGLIYFDLDSVELAYNDFSYCITTNYNVEKSMFYRGIILYNSGNKLEAYRDLSRVVAMGTGDSYTVIEAKRILDAHF